MEKSKKKPSFNATHPELKSEEVFIYNATELSFEDIKETWKTARKGKNAYTTEGQQMTEGYFPVFVNIKEKEERCQKR